MTPGSCRPAGSVLHAPATDEALSFYANVMGWSILSGEVTHGVLGVDDNPTVLVTRRPGIAAWHLAFTASDHRPLSEPFDLLADRRLDTMLGVVSQYADPFGAVFSLCQSSDAVRTQPPEWLEHKSVDPPRAGRVYAAAFHWTLVWTSSGFPNVAIDGDPRGGFVAVAGQGRWLPYFQVADTAAVCSSVVALGGSTITSPTEVGRGRRYAWCRDPWGADFKLLDALQDNWPLPPLID